MVSASDNTPHQRREQDGSRPLWEHISRQPIPSPHPKDYLHSNNSLGYENELVSNTIKEDYVEGSSNLLDYIIMWLTSSQNTMPYTKLKKYLTHKVCDFPQQFLSESRLSNHTYEEIELICRIVFKLIPKKILYTMDVINELETLYERENYDSENHRSGRSADDGHKHHTPQKVPHIYPYNDNEGLHALQYSDDTIPYIHTSQQYEYHEKKRPPSYIEVYPGAYQPEYTYSKIPRTYWMFHFFKGLFAVWEGLQTIAIIYLLYKVALLTLVPGREETNWDPLSFSTWDSILDTLHRISFISLRRTNDNTISDEAQSKYSPQSKGEDVAGLDDLDNMMNYVAGNIINEPNSTVSISTENEENISQDFPDRDFSFNDTKSELSDFIKDINDQFIKINMSGCVNCTFSSVEDNSTITKRSIEPMV